MADRKLWILLVRLRTTFRLVLSTWGRSVQWDGIQLWNQVCPFVWCSLQNNIDDSKSAANGDCVLAGFQEESIGIAAHVFVPNALWLSGYVPSAFALPPQIWTFMMRCCLYKWCCLVVFSQFSSTWLATKIHIECTPFEGNQSSTRWVSLPWFHCEAQLHGMQKNGSSFDMLTMVDDLKKHI